MRKIIMIIMLITMTILLIACSNQIDPKDNKSNLNTIPIFTISEAGNFTLEDCQARGLENKVVMIESKYCGHCQVTKPIFEEACQEAGVTPEILDISENDQREKMLSYSVEVQYTPTFIINCNYYIGGMEKSEYENLIQG
jgi:thiol-disulfide isomerase/thioredoxin